MRAIICTRYGSPEVLQLQEVEKPKPNDNEILVRIHATAVTSADYRTRRFKFPLLLWIPLRIMLGLRKPRKSILGTVLAGEIETVGKAVRRFKKGDRVFALSALGIGAYAEYTCMSEKGLVAIMPTHTSYEEAVAVPFGGASALYFLRKGHIQKDQRLLIYGASGAVGTSAVQLAKYFGAKITGVSSTTNLEMMKELGADKVIDYTKEDFAKNEVQYDMIFDAVGKIKRSNCKKVLAAKGEYISVENGFARVSLEDLLFLKGLMETGNLKGVIDKIYPLEQIAEAHRYADKGHKKGNVVITVGDGSGISET